MFLKSCMCSHSDFCSALPVCERKRCIFVLPFFATFVVLWRDDTHPYSRSAVPLCEHFVIVSTFLKRCIPLNSCIAILRSCFSLVNVSKEIHTHLYSCRAMPFCEHFERMHTPELIATFVVLLTFLKRCTLTLTPVVQCHSVNISEEMQALLHCHSANLLLSCEFWPCVVHCHSENLLFPCEHSYTHSDSYNVKSCMYIHSDSCSELLFYRCWSS